MLMIKILVQFTAGTKIYFPLSTKGFNCQVFYVECAA